MTFEIPIVWHDLIKDSDDMPKTDALICWVVTYDPDMKAYSFGNYGNANRMVWDKEHRRFVDQEPSLTRYYRSYGSYCLRLEDLSEWYRLDNKIVVAWAEPPAWYIPGPDGEKVGHVLG